MATCFGQRDSKYEAARGLYREANARIYPLLLIFEILKPPGEELQASLLEDERPQGADTCSPG